MAIAFRRPVGLALLVLSCGSPASELANLDLHRGRNALAMARHDWARVYFAADLERNPGRRESLRSLGLGWAVGSEGSLSKAIDGYERYLEFEPDDHDIRLHLIRARFRIGDADGALAALETLPDSAERRLLAARAHLDSAPAIAAEEIVRAIEVAPGELAPHLLAAKIYARLDNYSLVVAHATRATAIDPLHAGAAYLLATGLRHVGELERSQQVLDTYELLRRWSSSKLSRREELDLLRRLQGPPGTRSPGFRLRLARLLLASRRFEEAADIARELAEDPECQVKVIFELAQEAHSRGRVLLAGDLYSSILARSPGHTGALTQQAQLAYQAGDLSAAHRWLEAGLAEDSFYAPLHFIRGMVALSEHRESDAIVALRLAVDLVPWLASYRIALADVFLARGDREAFDRLLAASPVPDPALDAYRKKHLL